MSVNLRPPLNAHGTNVKPILLPSEHQAHKITSSLSRVEFIGKHLDVHLRNPHEEAMGYFCLQFKFQNRFA